MNGVGEESRGHILGRPWLVVGFILALGATAALVFGDDARWLRLGILAALWAALLGAFLALRYRRHAAQTEDAVARAQETYELELEREIDARREHELEVEAEIRQRVERDSRAELEALRSEVTALRESLQSLFGGEVLYERVALTAQSTRMRSLQDDQRVVHNAEPESVPGTLERGPQNPEGSERPTDLIERVREAGAAAQQQRASRPSGAPADMRSALAGTQGAPAAREARPAAPQARPAASEAPAARPKPGAGSAAARAAAAAGKARAEQAGPSRPAPSPATDDGTGIMPPASAAPPPSAPAPSAPAPSPPSPPSGPEPAEPRPASDAGGRQHEPASSYAQDWTPSWEAEQPGGHHLREEPEEPVEEEPNSTLPESVRAIQREGRPGGRRRRLDQDDGSGAPAETAESIDPALATGSSSEFEPASELAPDETSTAPPYEPSPEPTAPPTGGRRHRAEGAPTWQDVVGREKLDDIADSSNGRRVSPLPASSGTASSEEPSADEPGTEQESPAGSHTEGLSVSELLAAHGSSGSSPRRRRRAED